MQRWMAAKMILAKSHGTLKSGANRATGEVWDDRKGRAPTEKVEHETKARPRNVALLQSGDRPVAWGQGRKAKRLAARTHDTPFLASSRVIIGK